MQSDYWQLVIFPVLLSVCVTDTPLSVDHGRVYSDYSITAYRYKWAGLTSGRGQGQPTSANSITTYFKVLGAVSAARKAYMPANAPVPNDLLCYSVCDVS